jgi:hypothetical protein
MKRITITSRLELDRALKRIESIEDEVACLEDEIGDLKGEQDQIEVEIARFEKACKTAEESTAQKLWKHVQSCWQRFTWTEQRIAERAAQGEELEREEEHRFRMLCIQELHIVEP